MKLGSLFLILIIGISSVVNSQVPYLKKNAYGATQLIVKEKPYLMLAGEMYNSSSSNIGYTEKLMTLLSKSHINTVLLPVTWEMIEKKQGVFDFSNIAAIIQIARKNKLKVGILWFGTWKNGTSPYAPLWVLKDTNKFKRVKNNQQENTMTLSPFCEATKKADINAYTQMVKYIAGIDSKENTVIALQVENEVGVFGQSKDLSKESLNAFNTTVPEKLLAYLVNHKDQLEIELKTAWQNNGSKTNGTWKEVFGENEITDLFFMAWHYADYINEIAAAGKKIYSLPTFVNCWMPATPTPNPRPNYTSPGKFPSGGPVIMVMDIWKAAAPAIDIVTPDIYGNDFDLQTSFFHRYDNPLLIPETNAVKGRAAYSFAKHNAIGFSPFGIDDKYSLMEEEYEMLQQLEPLIIKYQGSDKVAGFYKTDKDNLPYEIQLNKDVLLKVYFKRPYNRANELLDSSTNIASYGLFIKISDDDFFIAGKNIWVSAISLNTQKIVWLKDAWQGTFKEGVWIPQALHNGDEAGFLWSKKTPVYRIKTDPTIKPNTDTEAAIFKFKVITYQK